MNSTMAMDLLVVLTRPCSSGCLSTQIALGAVLPTTKVLDGRNVKAVAHKQSVITRGCSEGSQILWWPGLVVV